MKISRHLKLRDTSSDEGGMRELLGWGPLLLLVYIYYVMSCGLEGFFQSNTYTYALCGPLKMDPTDANLLNILYYAAFVTGRLSGIFISRLVSPTKIIISSISGCIVGSLLLTVLAPLYSVALYVGVILMGFAISFQVTPTLISLTFRIKINIVILNFLKMLVSRKVEFHPDNSSLQVGSPGRPTCST